MNIASGSVNIKVNSYNGVKTNKLTFTNTSYDIPEIDYSVYNISQQADINEVVEGDINPTVEKLTGAGAVCVVGATSFLFGALELVENIGDGLIMAGGGLASLVAGIWDKEKAQSIKDGTAAAVEYDWTEAGYQATVNALNVDESIANSKLHTVVSGIGTTAAYIGISMIPGGSAVTVAAGALSAAGAASQQALQSGATFEQAAICGTVAAAAGAVAGGSLKAVHGFAAGTTSIAGVAGYTALGAAVSVTEPIVNSATQYLTYGKNLLNQNGEEYGLSLGGALSYYKDSGGLTQTVIAAATGAVSTGKLAARANKINNNYIENVISTKKENFKWDTAKKDYDLSNEKGAFDKLSESAQKEWMDKVDMTSTEAIEKIKEADETARGTIRTLRNMQLKNQFKIGHDATSVLEHIKDDIPQESYLNKRTVSKWKKAWGADSDGNVDVYIFQDINGYAYTAGDVGRPCTDAAKYTNPAGNGGAFVITSEQYNQIISDPAIFENGKCINQALLSEKLGGVPFNSDIIAIKQTVKIDQIELPRGSNKGAFFGEWCPGGLTSGGKIEGVVPQAKTTKFGGNATIIMH